MAALTEVLVPDIGDFEDVPVVEILVAVGDAIAKDDPMITLESDKATMEIPAPFGGVVKEIRVKLEDRIAEGAVILTLEADDDAVPEPREPAVEAPPAQDDAGGGATAAATSTSDTVHASPVARRMARDLGVDIASVEGSGPRGRVTKDDVLANAEPGSVPLPSSGHARPSGSR